MGRRLRFYRRVRNALLATNNKTDNSIITACNIAKPLADDKGMTVTNTVNYKKRSLVKGKIVNLNRTTEDKRK